MTRRVVIALVLMLLAGGVVGGVAIAQEGDSSNTDAEYTLSELRQDGKHYSQPSARIVPEEGRVYWLEHRPVNQPWKTVTKKSGGQKLAEDATLKTNSVYLRTIRASTGTKTVNVTVVSYDVSTRTITQGNTTRTEQVATNVTETTQQVELGPGWSLAEISLPHHDDTKQVTMWLEDHPDTARWTYPHKSVATTTPIAINTWSGFLMFAGGFVIVPALGGGAYGAKKVRAWVQKAGVPPGHGVGYYVGLTLAATLGIVMWLYYQAAEIIVTAPPVLGLGVAAAYVGYMLSTHEGNAEEKLFWQPHIESVDAFAKSKLPSIGAGNDDHAVSFSEDMPFGTMQSYRVLDEGQKGLSIVRDGWVPFLARLKGGRARIANADELKTRFSLWDSQWSEVFIVDPEAETLIEYEPPGLELKTPEIETWHDLVWPATILLAGGTAVWQLTQIYGVVAWALMLVAAPYLVWKFAVTGTDSHVYVDPAPVAMRPVLASMLAMQMGYDDASTLEEAEEFAWAALAGREKEDMTWSRNADQTLVEEGYGATPDDTGRDRPAADAEADDDPDDEAEPEPESNGHADVDAIEEFVRDEEVEADD